MKKLVSLIFIKNVFVMPVDAVNKHWRSSRDDATRKAHSKYEEHGNQVTRSNRLKRVSKNCLCAYRPGSYTP